MYNYTRKIWTLDQLINALGGIAGRSNPGLSPIRYVSTDGCFDILHAGHVDILTRCTKFASRLLVMLNVDEQVRILKGEGRPINTFDDRACLLAALHPVHWVIGLEEPTPGPMLERLYDAGVGPHVHVKGGDYTIEQMPEVAKVVQQYGGRVEILPFHIDRSTSQIIKQAKEL